MKGGEGEGGDRLKRGEGSGKFGERGGGDWREVGGGFVRGGEREGRRGEKR